MTLNVPRQHSPHLERPPELVLPTPTVAPIYAEIIKSLPVDDPSCQPGERHLPVIPLLKITGYGAGVTFTQLDATHRQINSGDGQVHDVITFSSPATIHTSDFLFV